MREIDRSTEDETVCSRGLLDKIVHAVVLKDTLSLFGAFAAAETVPHRFCADADDFHAFTAKTMVIFYFSLPSFFSQPSTAVLTAAASFWATWP